MLINALKLEVHSLAPLGLLIEDVKVLSHNFDKLFYSHTKKNDNSVAHNLAKYGKRISDFQLWMENTQGKQNYGKFAKAKLELAT